MVKLKKSFNQIFLVGTAGSLVAKVIILPVLIIKNKEMAGQLLAVGIPLIAANVYFLTKY